MWRVKDEDEEDDGWGHMGDYEEGDKGENEDEDEVVPRACVSHSPWLALVGSSHGKNPRLGSGVTTRYREAEVSQ